MIKFLKIEDLAEKGSYYLFPDFQQFDALEGLSVVRLKVKEEEYDSMVNTDLEFDKLVEFSCQFLYSDYDLYALFVERLPQRKRKLRTYAAMFYSLRKRLGNEYFSKKEFDLPENQSVFLGSMHIDQALFQVFLEELTGGSFEFGIFIDKDAPQAFLKDPGYLQEFFSRAITFHKHVYIAYPEVILFLGSPQTIIFSLTSDGQDHQIMEFYGRRDALLPKMDLLIARQEENFHLRRRRPWMDVNN